MYIPSTVCDCVHLQVPLMYNEQTHPAIRSFATTLGISLETGTDTWREGTRFAAFVRRTRVLFSPSHATRNLSFLRFHSVVSTYCFTGLVRVGVKIPQDGNRANGYRYVCMVHEHVWRTVCSVCATGARVAQPVPCNS